MKVLMVTHLRREDAGGMVDRVFGLVDAFAELGHEVDTLYLPLNKHLYSNRLRPWWYLKPSRKWVRAAIKRFPDYDLIVVSYFPVAVAVLAVAENQKIRGSVKSRLVYDAHNDEARLAGLTRPWYHRRWVERAQTLVIRAYGFSWVAGSDDCQRLAEAHPETRLIDLPNGVTALESLTHVEASAGEAFIYGSWSYPPNAMGLLSLASVETSAPGRIRVFGRLPEGLAEEVTRLAGRQPNVSWTFEGFKPDLLDILGCGGVGLVPVWSGGGTKLRTVQLLGSGVPTIITPEAASGLPSWILQFATVADTPAAMLDAALRSVVQDRLVRERGRARVLSELSWKALLTAALSQMETETALSQMETETLDRERRRT